MSVAHVSAAGLALLTGTYAWLTPRGTRRHRRVGALYVASMVGVEATAFRLYYLFGHFGLVHWGAVGSGLLLLLGVGAVVGRPAGWPAWRQWHYVGMGGSLLGLYTALVVESTYRLFAATYFWWSTLGVASVVLLGGAALLYHQFPAGRPRAQVH